MAWLIAGGALFTLLTLFFVGKTVSTARRRRFGRATLSCAGFVGSGGVAFALLLLVFSYYTYHRLTAEQVVADIEFSRVAPYEFRARLMVPGERDRFFLLTGDEWQLDARVISWQPPATVLGLDPIYRLDRLSGRYAEVDRERSAARTVYEISPAPAVDLWRVARRYPLLTPGIDAYYWTATYVPMADGARYTVSLSRDALIARPANDAAAEAVGDWN